jgi:hypothetical protein
MVNSDSGESPLPSHVGAYAVDRRRSHREPVVTIARLTPLEPSDSSPRPRPVQVLVTDVSLHGCDFRTPLPPRDGAFYRIEMNVGPLFLASRIRVMRISSRNDGNFDTAAEFI